MGIGEFTKTVVFKQNTPTTLGAGKKDAYTTLLTTKGRLKKQSGSRSLGFGDIQITNSYELLVRYQSSLATNLRADVKIEIDSKTFTIQTFEKIGEKNFYYRFIIVEQ